jgi:CubicO group peptidase (beta-lactamase class C family)
MEEHGFPGMALAVVRDGALLHTAGIGHRDGEGARAVTPRTLFHMASVTKTFTATAIMQLIEKRAFGLDTPVVEIIPEFRLDDARTPDLKIRHLLTHRSGIPDNETLDWENPQWDDWALERHIAGLSDRSFRWDPGEHFDYTDISFEILGYVVARTTGMVFEDYIAKRILVPLGMKDSTLLHKRAERVRLATPHIHDELGWVRPSDVFPYSRQHAPSSTLLTNAVDLSRWMLAGLNRGVLHGHRILKPKSYDRLWKETGRTQGTFWSGIGMGYFRGEHSGRWFVGHEGSDRGFRASMVLLPEEELGVAVITNLDGDNIKPLMRELLDTLLD